MHWKYLIRISSFNFIGNWLYVLNWLQLQRISEVPLKTNEQHNNNQPLFYITWLGSIVAVSALMSNGFIKNHLKIVSGGFIETKPKKNGSAKTYVESIKGIYKALPRQPFWKSKKSFSWKFISKSWRYIKEMLCGRQLVEHLRHFKTLKSLLWK